MREIRPNGACLVSHAACRTGRCFPLRIRLRCPRAQCFKCKSFGVGLRSILQVENTAPSIDILTRIEADASNVTRANGQL